MDAEGSERRLEIVGGSPMGSNLSIRGLARRLVTIIGIATEGGAAIITIAMPVV